MTWKQILILRRRFERIHKGKIYKALMDQLNDVLHEVNVGVLDVLPEKIKTIVSDKSVRKAFYSLYDDVGWEFYRAFKVKKSSEDIRTFFVGSDL